MAGGGKGGQNTTTVQQQTNPEALAAYHNAVQTGTNVAKQPYPTYDSPLVAGFNPTQTAAFGNINSAAGLGQSYFDQAGKLIQASTSGINPAATVDQYMNPYNLDVVHSLEGIQGERNARQASDVAGGAISAGAFGGDRSAIQQGILAREQNLADNATNAGVLQHGFDTALSTGLQTQQANAGLANQGAYALGNIGSAAQNAALTGAGAQLQAGNQQQTQEQNQLNIPYGQFQQAQAYPYQITNMLSGLAQAGSGAGSTSSQTTPGPSGLSQIAGLGLTGLGAYSAFPGAFSALGSLFGLADGGAVLERADGGRIAGFGHLAPPMPRYTMQGLTGLPGMPHFAGGGGVDDDPDVGFGVPYTGSELENTLSLNTAPSDGYVPGIPMASAPKVAAIDPVGLNVPPPNAPKQGAAMDPNDTNIPRPRRLNNPGALKFAGQPGALNVDGFALFPSREAGAAAADANLAGYGSKHGINTLAGAISRWAPEFDEKGNRINDTPGYIKRVAAATGIDPTAPIDLTDQSVRAKILPAMFDVEDGGGGSGGGGAPIPVATAANDAPAGLNVPPGSAMPPPAVPDRASGLRSPGMALLAAGLGILGGNSPHAAVNIGQGGLQGLGFMAQQDKEAEARALRKATMEQTSQFHQGELENRRATLALQAANHADLMGVNRQRIEQGRYSYVPWTQPDPNDPSKTISGMMRTSARSDEPPQFIPTTGVPTNKADPTAAVFNAGSAGNKHGDEYLSTLPPTIGQQVKALAEGRMQFPGSFALKTPYWQNMLSAVAQFDPNFDAVNYNARAATRKDFTSGKSAQNITSFNTAIGHLGTLADSAGALDNSAFKAYNTVANWLTSAKGDPRVNNFNLARNAVADELTRAFRGTGGSEGEVKRWESTLNSAQSPEQLQGAIKQGVELLRSRINAVGESYQRGMGTSQNPVSLLSSSAQKTLDKLEGSAKPASGDAAAVPEGRIVTQGGKRYRKQGDGFVEVAP